MSEMEKYLQSVSAGLNKLPENERNEILAEIRNHIHEAINRQEPINVVIDRLGHPLRLAQSYANIYNIESGNKDFNIWRDMTFFFSAGLASYVVVPTLFLMAVVLPLTSIFMVGYTLLDLFIDLPGDNLNVEMWYGLTLTGFPAIIVTLVFGVIFFIFGILCWKLLKKYLAFISLRYKKFRIDD
ncbi:MAG: DUF1700 domain-containing protein [Defluviitaleaceae bacterium]|nr:DUF1700 domain-containing protein [Defluviitaleaceae bacterium]